MGSNWPNFRGKQHCCKSLFHWAWGCSELGRGRGGKGGKGAEKGRRSHWKAQSRISLAIWLVTSDKNFLTARPVQRPFSR